MACPAGHDSLEGGIRAPLRDGVPPIAYNEYLQLDKLLSSQHMRSPSVLDAPAHDEHLFIIVHQVYELWFKQVIYEVDSIRAMFAEPTLEERLMLRISQRLGRVVAILKLCVEQVHILETMTAPDFMGFRDLLVPASGFQSCQFRVLENKLGIEKSSRVKYHAADYVDSLVEGREKDAARASEADPSLVVLIQAWLERTPGIDSPFFSELQRNVEQDHRINREKAEAIADEEHRKAALLSCTVAERTFASLFDPELHAEAVANGKRRLSHRATQGALLIYLHRDLPRFHIPFTVMSLLNDVDSQLMEWRQNHVDLVQRMIGTKMGTGGSSGYHYLRATLSDRYKVFHDLVNLATFLVPKCLIPPLDEATERRLSNRA